MSQCLSGRYLSKCGVQTGFEIGKSGNLILSNKSKVGVFVSPIYDSGRADTEWNRLVLEIGRNALIQVYVFLFDEKAKREMSDMAEDFGKLVDYVKNRAQYVSHYREQLLYGQPAGCGRFARFVLEVYAPESQKGARPAFDGYAMSFPKESFTRYLPSIYQGKLQLERYLAVQQSLYLELEKEIDTIATQLDYELCRKDQIKHLAHWMGWGSLAESADQDTMRKLLGTGLSLISRKGSKTYYEELAEILTGCRAILLENIEKSECTLLFLESPQEERKKYLDWIRDNVPIGVKMKIVILDKTSRLDGQFFLDKTAYISDYEWELSENGVDVDRIQLL